MRLIFRPKSEIQTFEGRLFSNEGGYFQFFTKNRPQNHQKGAILHTSQANGGLPPGYATAYNDAIRTLFAQCTQPKYRDLSTNNMRRY